GAQQGKPASFATIVSLARDPGWLARAVWWRYVYRRLLAPSESRFELHLVIEQMPKRTNRITLSTDRRDEHGCPLAVIDWRVGDSDVESFRVVYELFAAEWNRSSLAGIASLAPRPPEAWRRDLVLGGGIYHPGGSIRIGSTPQRGVVDDRLKTFRISD